jgi:hypothetical protein
VALRTRPLECKEADALESDLARSITLVGRRDAKEVIALVREHVDEARFARVQQEVMAGSRIPSY